MDKDVINDVRNLFDLNQYEVGIWIHLLSRGVSTAGELSDLSNVPRSRAYDVLESLEKKGFVVIKIGKPIQYIAVPPKEVIHRVQKNIKEETEARIKKLESMKESDLLNNINELYNKGIKTYSPTDLSGAFRGRKNIYDKMESMIREAQTSIKIVTTEEGLINNLNNLKNAMKKANERGVKIQIKTPITANNKEAIDSLKPFIEIKNNEDPSARYCIIDDKQALMLLLNEDGVHPDYEIGVWLNSEAVSKTLGKNV